MNSKNIYGTIGIIVADSDEYAPLENKIAEYGAVPATVAGRPAHRFKVKSKNGGQDISVISVHCGIGKVNAAATAAALCENGVKAVLNYGLSGGISGVSKGQVCIPDKFLEHDFDLCCIGYKPAQKPDQDKYIYNSDITLVDSLKSLFPCAKSGTAVTGDSFVQSSEKREFLKKEFGAVCCDMETAAIASVCNAYGVPFAALRLISDDAGDDAGVSYREVNAVPHYEIVDAILQTASIF